ncbi:MAG: hypothetical protein FWD17_00610 [Polyangiaceae bacterium]|nr:hypothetical protein [Polyangiaceae bacterium]
MSRAFVSSASSASSASHDDGGSFAHDAEIGWISHVDPGDFRAKVTPVIDVACDSAPRVPAHGPISHYNYLFAFPVACIETSLSGVVQQTNEDAAQLLNVASACLVNKPLVHFVARGDCNIFRAAVECVGCGKALDRVVVRFRPRRGPAVARIALSGRRLDRLKPRRIVWVLHRA